MGDKLRDAALEYHRARPAGKIALQPTKPLGNQSDLALAYSPGVAAACEEIVKDPKNASQYTTRGNLVAVITNGTAVLGLGNIAWSSGRHSEALEHFSELVRRFPDYQAGWNNLATGMEELGCTEAAEQVRACAANHSQNGIHVGADAACTVPVCR